MDGQAARLTLRQQTAHRLWLLFCELPAVEFSTNNLYQYCRHQTPVSHSTVEKAIADLHARGLIVSIRRGYWKRTAPAAPPLYEKPYTQDTRINPRHGYPFHIFHIFHITQTIQRLLNSIFR